MSIALGVLTAVGGGALRDVALGEVPGIFKASNFYAVAALAGSFFVRGACGIWRAGYARGGSVCGLRGHAALPERAVQLETGSDKLMHRH